MAAYCQNLPQHLIIDRLDYEQLATCPLESEQLVSLKLKRWTDAGPDCIRKWSCADTALQT